jgi:hypothetical protein
MNENRIFIVIKGMSNAINTINELDELITYGERQTRITELKKRREQLFEVLRELVQDLEDEIASGYSNSPNQFNYC